ncbi:expressed unknown protein [Seminavis robusta]|uniref:Uncharacterized protein n=1 Tax=Seminavis robusta TaxID=568900 RepID=A0A9N8DNL5_9STRA|nr:expressed unknown protein [Seminavis robusta]|eukprot:Sro182_g079510.1 n/a (219) ;mRNA; r:88660-89316
MAYAGDRLRITAPKRSIKQFERGESVTVAHPHEHLRALAACTTHGATFHQTKGDMINSDEFFQSKMMEQRDADIKALKQKKENTMALQKAKDEADAIIAEKGEPTTENMKEFSATELDILHKYKFGKKGQGKKADVLKAYLEAPPPLKIVPWSPEDEEELRRLETDEIPLEDTALATAVHQQAAAVGNNINMLSLDERRKLMGTIGASLEEVKEVVVV